MLAFHRLPARRLPRDGGRLENLRTGLLVERAKRSGAARRPPAGDPLDEYPLVPYLVTPNGEVLYDTSALAPWLDAAASSGASGGARLVPEDAATRFVVRFLDEAFDELGLYLVHHNRWKLAAADNEAPGRRLAREYARQIPPGSGAVFAAWFARRQVRRLPYLFSVAPAGYRVEGLPKGLTPPSREGFPPTHALLETIWTRVLAALEELLAAQPFLLGACFTLADASAYGQLSMNLTDGLAARRLRELAPRTFDWLVSIRDRRPVGAGAEASPGFGPGLPGPGLAPGIGLPLGSLLGLMLETFVPLMRANAAAWASHRARGETRFNEAGFDAGVGLYDGELLGHPFRSVVKTFQVRVWRDLCAEWTALGASDRARVAGLVPGASAESLDAALRWDDEGRDRGSGPVASCPDLPSPPSSR